MSIIPLFCKIPIYIPPYLAVRIQVSAASRPNILKVDSGITAIG